MAHLRWLQVTDDALTFAVGIVDDDLDRVDALDRTASRRATPAHELSQLAAQIVFNGPRLDTTRWSHRATGPRYDGILTPDAVSVGGGALTIKTYTQAGRHYSGMISTHEVGSVGFEQTYGYFEARVKFNSSPGQWSAFWLHSPTFGNPIGDPATTGVAMDVAEHRRRCVIAPSPIPPEMCGPSKDISNRIQQALIWDGYGPDSKAAVRLSDPLAGLSNGSWHTWALRWTPKGLTFHYDGMGIWSGTGVTSLRSQYIILSSEVGAFFAGAIPRSGYGSRLTSTTKMQSTTSGSGRWAEH